MSFSRFGERILPSILKNFMGSVEGENQWAKSGCSAELEEQCSFLEELAIAFVGLSCTHHLVLVACLMQAQVHFLQLICTTTLLLIKSSPVYGFGEISG